VSGLLQLLSLGARSLSASQLAQATVGNNAANAATPGFSRRRVTLTEAPGLQIPQGFLGTGVVAEDVVRLRNAFIDVQRRLDRQELNYSTAQADILAGAETFFAPADASGLATSLNGLFAAFGDLAVRPDDGAVRRALLIEAQAFVDAVRQTRVRLDQLKSDTFGAIETRVTEINDVAGRLARLNAEMSQAAPDPSLADERDRLADRLAELIGVRVTTRPDGTVQAVVDGTGIQLVDGSRAATIVATGTAMAGTVGLTIDGIALASVRGELGGLLAARNSTADGVPSIIANLDSLASGVITAVNRVHASGAGLTLPQSVTGSVTVATPAAMLDAAGLMPTPANGTLELGVFTAAGVFVSAGSVAVDPATMSLDDLAAALDALPDITAAVVAGQLQVSATNAGNRLALGPDSSDSLVALGVNGLFTGSDSASIAVSSALTADPSLIAAAQADFTAGVVSPGDGRNARALQALAASRVFGTSSETATEFLGTVGGAVGATVQAARARVDVHEALLAAAEAQHQAASGVNLDEELADMVRYQRSYEAAARYIRTIDEMVGTLMEIL
jgi:flagellar hook-associated protein 1 FlgK